MVDAPIGCHPPLFPPTAVSPKRHVTASLDVTAMEPPSRWSLRALPAHAPTQTCESAAALLALVSAQAPAARRSASLPTTMAGPRAGH